MSESTLLDREEYIEQAYFFRTFRERLNQSTPTQEILELIAEEILVTTRLPIALKFLHGEIVLTGRISDGMARLSHYFSPFQTFILHRAEDDRAEFDHRIGLLILEREAEYRAANASMAGTFIFQFECISRNRLGYDAGMAAIAGDPIFNTPWRRFIGHLSRELGTRDLAELLYLQSEQFAEDQRAKNRKPPSEESILFGLKEGRIARANRGRDPLYMFAALQRQLGYPAVPRPKPASAESQIPAVLEQRLIKMEKRIKLLEMEAKGGLDLDKFMTDGELPGFDD